MKHAKSTYGQMVTYHGVEVEIFTQRNQEL